MNIRNMNKQNNIEMKATRRYNYRFYGVALLLFVCLSLFSGCSRDDDGVIRVEKGNEFTFSVVGSVNDLSSKVGSSAEGSAVSAAASAAGSSVTLLSSDIIATVDGKAVYLDVTEQDNIVSVDQLQTKVAPTTGSNITNSPFGIIAYTYASGQSSTPSTWALYQRSSVGYSSSVWSASPSIFLPNRGEKMRFFAYHPSSVSVSATAGSAPLISNFTVDGNVSNQVDLLIGRTAQAEYDDNAATNVGVAFDHALCGVRFRVSGGVTVKSINISGVNDRGTLSFSTSGTPSYSWSGLGISSSSKVFTISNPTTTTDGSYKVFDDEYTFMMIPQSLSSGAKITIDIGETPVELSLSGTWSAGKLITYTINSGYDYYFIVSDPTDLSYVGGTSTTGKITSYKTLKSGGGTQVPLAVTIDGNYFYDTYEKAVAGLSADRTPIASGNFISSITPSVSGINTSLTIGYAGTTNQGTGTYSASDLNAKIASKALMGSSSNYINLSNPNDLSTNVGSNTIVETANTYIVNGAGYYKIPLVMGNGVKNNGLNENAYQQSGFVNYMGDAMTSRTTPYLQDNSGGGVPTSAYIVWANKNFIEVENTTDYVIQSGSPTINAINSTTSGSQQVYWLNFHVSDASTQAVAVIGIRDQNSTTMWSYTIWLTDYIPFNYPGYDSATNKHKDVEVTGYSDASNPEGTPLKVTFMPRNLGWVETTTGTITSNYYEGQEAYVRVKQAETDDIKVVKIIRPRSATQSGARKGYYPYYQWGRKDALLPSNGTGINTNLSAVGVNRGFVKEDPKSLDYVIQNPHRFYDRTGSTDWTTSTGNNGWWCAGNTATSVDKATVKTIYDPSPAGYVVPRYNAFLAFRAGTTGYAPNSTNEAFNSVGGYYFYTGYRASSSASTAGMGTIFFPAGGFRSDSGNLSAVGSTGGYWSAVPNPNPLNTGHYLVFTSGSVIPQNYNYRYGGFGLRCQRDEL